MAAPATAPGNWHGGFSPQTQADWAANFTPLALCKPYVQGVNWIHFSDDRPHQFPHSGLLDHTGQPLPALDVLGDLRALHLS